jgi:hypothetical protein
MTDTTRTDTISTDTYAVQQYGAAHQRPFYRENVSRALRVAGLTSPAPVPPGAGLVAHWALCDDDYSPRVRVVALRIRERLYGDAATY